MMPAMNAGSSGVKAFTTAMTVTGSNIANINTTGYKSNRVVFQDLLATSLNSDEQLGTGVEIGNVQPLFHQGSFEPSELPTDIAIDGKGFFAVKDQFGKEFYSRAGQFQYSKEGILTTNEGLELQVRNIDPITNKSVGSLKHINILNQKIPPTATGNGVLKGTGIIIEANVDKNSIAPKTALVLENVTPNMYNFSIPASIYDAAGERHMVNIAFRKLQDMPPSKNPETGEVIPGVKNKWNWLTLIDGKEIEGGVPGEMKAVGGGFVSFSDDGKLLETTNGQLVATPSKDPKGPPGAMQLIGVPADPNNPRPFFLIQFKGIGIAQQVGVDFGDGFDPNNPEDQRTGLDGVTQFSYSNKIVGVQNDGSEVATIENMRVDSDGTIYGVFDNGTQRAVGRIMLARFKGEDDLTRKGNNLYVSSYKSGVPIYQDPGQYGVGKLRQNSLEKSNVDLSNEFVDMIENQRAFQANAKTISTSDEMIAELVQMKR